MSPADPGFIRDQCEILKKIVIGSSLEFGEETGLLNEIDAIAETAKTHPDEAAYRLHLKTTYLREAAILTGEQYRKLFESD